MMSRILLLLFIGILPTSAYASTFIGNGGNLMDGVLRSTLSAIAAANEQALKSDEELCVCHGSSKQCALLSDLSHEQVAFCAAFIKSHAADLSKLLSEKFGVTFKWVANGLTEKGSSRAVDAITQKANKRILLDENRFRDMSSADRIQLMTHEFGHLMSWNGKDIGDAGAMGPFTGKDGSRDFLDALGAAYTIEAMRAEAIPLQSSDWSSPFYRLRVGVTVGTQTESRSFRSTSFVDKDTDVVSVSVSYYQRPTSRLGLALRYIREFSGDSSTGVAAGFNRQLIYPGLEWRDLLLSGDTDYWLSSIHYSIMAGLGGGMVKHSLQDDFNIYKGSQKAFGAYLELGLHAPLIYGVFIDGTCSIQYLPYKISGLGIERKDVFQTILLGVSYGY
jgi:hypothetical protein